jgi:hypothetical protein
MTEPRFYVRELTGYPITTANRGGTTRQRTSCYVLDRIYNCRVVAVFEYSRRSHLQTLARYRAAADREARRLNEWWATELARG